MLKLIARVLSFPIILPFIVLFYLVSYALYAWNIDNMEKPAFWPHQETTFAP